MVKEEFKHLEATRWVVREFKRRGLNALFTLATVTAHLHHVGLFYQHLSYDCERLGVLSTSLDEVDIEVTPNVIAIGCPLECPPELVKRDGTPRYGNPPPSLTVQAIVDDMCGGRYTNEHQMCGSNMDLLVQF
jgi:hypothetical protein